MHEIQFITGHSHISQVRIARNFNSLNKYKSLCIHITEVIRLKIIIKNAEEAKDYIKEIRGSVIAEILFSELMKQPEPVRIKLFEMLTEKEEGRNT